MFAHVQLKTSLLKKKKWGRWLYYYLSDIKAISLKKAVKRSTDSLPVIGWTKMQCIVNFWGVVEPEAMIGIWLLNFIYKCKHSLTLIFKAINTLINRLRTELMGIEINLYFFQCRVVIFLIPTYKLISYIYFVYQKYSNVILCCNKLRSMIQTNGKTNLAPTWFLTIRIGNHQVSIFILRYSKNIRCTWISLIFSHSIVQT